MSTSATGSSSPREHGGTMSFGDHLEELRRRVFLAVVVPIPLMVILFMVAPQVRELLQRPVEAALAEHGLHTPMQVLSPLETILVDLKLSLIGALVISAPWVLWQAWLFVAPGLYAHERRYVHFLLPLSGVLVLSGIALLYFVLLPLILSAMVGFGAGEPTALSAGADASASTPIPVLAADPAHAEAGQMWVLKGTGEVRIAVPGEGDALEVAALQTYRPGGLLQQFRLREYVDLVLLFTLAIAIIFQLPVVILLLGWIGLVTPDSLRKHRRYAILGAAVIGALVGPGDLVSMLVLAAPVYLLYEVSILLLVLAPARRVGAGTLLRRERGDEGDE